MKFTYILRIRSLALKFIVKNLSKIPLLSIHDDFPELSRHMKVIPVRIHGVMD